MNELNNFIQQVEAHHKQTGYYADSVHVDKIYRTRKTESSVKKKELE